MIVMINGAYGAGKTTTAQRLQNALPNSMIFDGPTNNPKSAWIR